MKKKIMEKWTAALRSGEYKQGKNQLRTESNKFCCLGVLCNLHAIEHPKFAANQLNKEYYDNSMEVLPARVMKWAGMLSDEGWIDSKAQHLTSLNDNGMTFKYLAKLIEENYKEL